MSIVAHLEGKFLEHKQCNNPDYLQAVFAFSQEVYGQVFKVEDMPRPQRTNVLFNINENKDLLNLQPNQKYKCMCSLSVRQPNEKNGRTYPASININILKTQPCT